MDPHRQRQRFLVADDTPLVAEMVCDYLRDLDLDVPAPAGDGLQALHLFETLRPDGAVIDYEMPGLNGIELARAIRSSPSGTDCLLVMLTSHSEPELHDQALEAGFDQVIVKSSDLGRLAAIVAAHERRGRPSTSPGGAA